MSFIQRYLNRPKTKDVVIRNTNGNPVWMCTKRAVKVIDDFGRDGITWLNIILYTDQRTDHGIEHDPLTVFELRRMPFKQRNGLYRWAFFADTSDGISQVAFRFDRNGMIVENHDLDFKEREEVMRLRLASPFDNKQQYLEVMLKDGSTYLVLLHDVEDGESA